MKDKQITYYLGSNMKTSYFYYNDVKFKRRWFPFGALFFKGLLKKRSQIEGGVGALCHLRNTGAQRFQSLCVCLQEYLVADDIRGITWASSRATGSFHCRMHACL